MSGLGGLNKAPDGVVIGLVQIQNPVVVTPEDLAQQTERICALVGKARRNLVTTTGFWICTSPITTPSGALLSPPNPLIASSVG